MTLLQMTAMEPPSSIQLLSAVDFCKQRYNKTLDTRWFTKCGISVQTRGPKYGGHIASAAWKQFTYLMGMYMCRLKMDEQLLAKLKVKLVFPPRLASTRSKH
jgi:hypothetical protein